MAFDPKKLPARVYEAYKMGVMAWPLVIQEALDAGIYDLNKLTDILFHIHHPERKGRALTADESGSIKKWKAYRGMIASRREGHIRERKSAFASAAAMPVSGGGSYYHGRRNDEYSARTGFGPSQGRDPDPDHPSHGVLPVFN